jgi:hypothetical protein
MKEIPTSNCAGILGVNQTHSHANESALLHLVSLVPTHEIINSEMGHNIVYLISLKLVFDF